MRNLVSLVLALTLALASLAQSFDKGNDWYRTAPNRVFVKMLVAEEGIYRVSAQALRNAGLDLTGKNPINVQLIYRGKQARRYIQRDNTGEIAFVEFYGKPNDGRVDSMMYRKPDDKSETFPEAQPNKEVSLFSDSSAYFLTWSTTAFGLNVSSFVNLDYSLPVEPAVRSQAKIEYLPGVPGTQYMYGGGGAESIYFTLNSDYNTGEGYVGPHFGCNSPTTITLNTPYAVVGANEVDVEARVFGRSTFQHQHRVSINGLSPAIIDSITSAVNMASYRRHLTTTISSQTTLAFEALNCGNAAQNPDNNHIVRAAITYDRLLTLANGSTLRIWDWQKDALAHLRFTNVTGQDSVFIYDLTRNLRIGGMVGYSGSDVADIVLPKDAAKRQLFLATDQGIKTPVIVPHALSALHNPAGGGADYVIITSRKLAESAEAYQTYRDTCTVGDTAIKKVMVVYMDQIYDEYGYGTVTPWAIKRFCKDAYDSWAIRPKYFLLWGKGSYLTRNAAYNLVPTYNYPATDYEFVGHYDNTNDYRTWAAIGRVNVYNNQEGLDYLAKVADYEHQTWKSWMKNGVFLGGGQTEPEQEAIAGALKVDSVLFTGPPFGGVLTYYQKKTNTTIDDNPDLAEYHNQISSGISLIHFFGHSTNNIQDIKIRNANEYQNFGKYPFMIAFGCYGGDFTQSKSFGETWLTEPGRGAIGYFANSSAGYLSPLAEYAKIFYPYLYGDKGFGTSVGENIRNCLAQFIAPGGFPSNKMNINHGRQLNLQGDPAIVLLHPTKPDLSIDEPSIYFSPDNFTAQSDSFEIKVIVQNLALVPKSDSVRISFRQQYPNGNDTTIYRTYPMVRSKDTVSLRVYRQLGQDNTGENRFEVMVDYPDSLLEYDESNNFASVRKVIPGNIPAPVFPYEFAIIDTNRIHLDASSYFMTRDSLINYIYQIDTSYLFTSPLMVESPVITGKATYSTWNPPITLQDSQVYYWRVRLADYTPVTWAVSSFKYIPGKTGWSQAQLPQFLKDNRRRISPNLNLMQWQFDEKKATYSIEVNGSAVQITFNNSLLYFLEYGGPQYFDLVNGSGLGMMIINQHTMEKRMGYWLYLPQDANTMRAALSSMEEGDYVLLAAPKGWNNYLPNCPADIFSLLENEFGANPQLRTLSSTDDLLVFLRKGAKSPVAEAYELPAGQTGKLSLEIMLKSRWPEGRITSTLVGPTTDWSTFDWSWYTRETPLRDKVLINLYGVRKDNTDSLILANLSTEGLSDISAIKAANFPYLRLVASKYDSTYITAPQLEKWQVYHAAIPDAVVEVVDNFLFDADTVAEGRDVTLRMAAENKTDIGMDSLLVRFYLEREDRTKVDLGYRRLAPLPAKGRIEFSYTFNTLSKELSGATRLFVIINPDLDQIEQHFFNNVYIHNFNVLKDRINPLVDITFDGKHILNGDYVSPTPEIRVRVQDENRYMAMNDSTSFEIYFQETIGFAQKISLSDPRIEWQPATLPDNKATIIFRPGKDLPLEDNADAKRYKLRVQGRDKTLNVAGKNNSFYEVEFQVLNQSSISNVVNYPNPFSSSTRFVYTLTGDKIPTRFEIQIYTITGKLVKVIDLLAHENVYIGNNITDYAWDGTDAYGDPLANGVYLYKVVTEIPGVDTYRSSDAALDGKLENSYRSINDGTRDYFTKGWGKMYLMR